MSLKDQFNQLPPSRKKALVWCLIGIVVLVIAVTGYNSRSRRMEQVVTKTEKEIHLDPDLIEKTMLKEQRREISELQKQMSEMQKQQENAAKTAPPAEDKDPEKKPAEELPAIPDADSVAQAGKFIELPQPMNMNTPPAPPKEKKIVGKIAVVNNPAANKKEDDKKKGRSVYLPPSFMEANLLTGFDAATSGTGKNSPEPLLLRIQTPAVLPNDIKADLAGCFVIAEAVGRLDKERADVRLVSLSCLSNEGKAVIDTPVKGFVTDSDSKVGLSGRVVSRMGAATARAIIAGLFEGAGDALKAAAMTQTDTPWGTTNSIDSSQVAKYSIGGGLSEGANTLSDFYMTLAKQTTPVIEVGATKKITVIVSEGKDLEIKEKVYEEENQ